MNRQRLYRAGFTLIEVMIVLAIVLALAGLVGVMVFQRREQADTQIAELQLRNIKKGLDMFRLDFKRFPTDEEGIAVLWNQERLGPEADTDKWLSYLDEPVPQDPWGNAWGYRAEGETREGFYDLWSNGPDGEEGTEDDISVWSAFDEEGDGGFDTGFDEPVGGMPSPPPAGGG